MPPPDAQKAFTVPVPFRSVKPRRMESGPSPLLKVATLPFASASMRIAPGSSVLSTVIAFPRKSIVST